MSAEPTQPAYRNPLTAYLLLLQKCKHKLPHGMLVCVSASPNITTTAALLRLAYAVGPFIAVLQIHADIIDDWSAESARRVGFLAKRFGFLIWEGGRILNVRRSKISAVRSSEEIARDVEMARKRYTRGLVSVANWAGLVSSWMFNQDEQGKGGDILVPTLRRAARDTVSAMTRSVETEITAGIDPCREFRGTVHNDNRDGGSSNEAQSSTESGDSADTGNTSVISLIHTITQRTEPSNPSSPTEEANAYTDDEQDVWETMSSENYPPPPLLTRGLLIYLATNNDYTRPATYRSPEANTARTHNDFVVGFVTDEPWTTLSASKELIIRWLSEEAHIDPAEGHCDRWNNRGSEIGNQDQQAFVVFAQLEPGHFAHSLVDHTECVETCSDIGNTLSEDVAPGDIDQESIPSAYRRQILALRQLVAQARSMQVTKTSTSSETDSTPGHGAPEVICIPVMSMNV